MSELTLQRIPFNIDADNKLRSLKARTGLSANIICRLGFCISLEEPGLPNKLEYEYKQGREINRYTLLGKHDNLYLSLLKIRLQNDHIKYDTLDGHFLEHIHRGIEILSARIRSIGDIGLLF